MSEPTPPVPLPAPRARRRFPGPMLAGLLCCVALPAAAVALMVGNSANHAREPDQPAAPPETPVAARQGDKKTPAPEFDEGLVWLNSAGPISMKKDLKGKIVLLDFWTLCCINCIHVMPDLAKLEKKYANELVVIGVHSPKFENEKDTASIRKAILRYQIEHPVVNDADHKVWNRYGVQAWPTLVLIDPEGNVLGELSGEGNYEILDRVIGKLVADHKEKKTLNEKPIRFDLARFRETGDTPLFFPGKVLADEKSKRLFIADSTHHRVVITDLDGKFVAAAGTGEPGLTDGAFDKAQFQDPQGMALSGDTLYLADRKNHAIRELNLKEKTVRTVAGKGTQEFGVQARFLDRPVPATSIGLNSPWDLLLDGDALYVAMAGHHQIWVYDVKNKTVAPFAGSGRETLGDGPPAFAHFAQPSGLASDGKNLYVADSETSSLRKVPLDGAGRVQTLVGRGLFVFGDRDGPGQDGGEESKSEARMQHALGVVYHDGLLYVADTYNSKVKVYDPRTRELKTLAGGSDWGWLIPGDFSEPAGISYANGKLYVADTNAHRIRTIDLATKEVATLKLTGVEPPPPPKEPEPKK